MDRSISLKNIQVSASLEDQVRLGVVFFKSLSIGEGQAELTRAIDGFAEELRQSLADRRPSTVSIVERTRRLYHQVGLDPTKHRPSSEKLLRRVLRGKPFPRINNFVDALNLVSLKLQFPLGLYDWDRLVPPVLARIGQPNEKYVDLSGEIVGLEGKIVLVDGEGAFGNPTHDSERSKITTKSVRTLVTLFAPADIPRDELEEGIRTVTQAGIDACEGQAAATGIIP